MYLKKTPHFLKKIFPQLIWGFPPGNKTLYLTFDDGPHPEITNQILAILKSYNARGTFFCLGRNVELYPDIKDKIVRSGHEIGNHGYNHINGWQSDDFSYYQDIHKGSVLCESFLFRPPYGKIKPSQIRLIQQDFKIIMWSVMSGDFDTGLSPENCLKKTIKRIRDGDIILFHDSKKAADRVLYVLPELLDHFSGKGYKFESIIFEREYVCHLPPSTE